MKAYDEILFPIQAINGPGQEKAGNWSSKLKKVKRCVGQISDFSSLSKTQLLLLSSLPAAGSPPIGNFS